MDHIHILNVAGFKVAVVLYETLSRMEKEGRTGGAPLALLTPEEGGSPIM